MTRGLAAAALLLVVVAYVHGGEMSRAHDPARPAVTFAREIRALLSARCTTCHAPVSPASMPYATWEMVLPRMEQRIRASQPPMSAEEQRAIETYLKKYSG